MSVVGADAGEMRSAAQQFTQAAERLDGLLLSLNGYISNAGFWRGPDAQRFRSEWTGQSTHAIKAASTLLRGGADTLRRNADEQEKASAADGGNTGGATRSIVDDTDKLGMTNSRNTNDMWHQIKGIPNEENSSGYRVQKIETAPGEYRYVVYIVGTDGSSSQTVASNYNAVRGTLDDKQVKALERLIPDGAEVMLVGYSQGGIDAQNIAKSGKFDVTQIVTFGSPARFDLDVPAVHLRANGDLIPNSGSAFAVGGPLLGSLGGPMGAIRGGLMTANPYVLSALPIGANNEYFNADSAFCSEDPMAHHNNGYENVSKEYDKAVANGDAGRMDKHTSDFEGDVVDYVDIRADGSGDW
jgi:uncharacterized protein YukE